MEDKKVPLNSQDTFVETQKVLKQLVRQLKIMNFWITFFGSLAIVAVLFTGFLLMKVVTAIQSTEQRITSIQQNAQQQLTVKDDICQSEFLKNTSFCKSE